MKFNSDSQRKQTQPADELDRMLDVALAKYAAVEPRAGLEGRLLRRLRSEPLPPARRVWLQWGLVGAVATIALVAVLAWRSDRAPHPAIANHLPAAIQRQSIQETKPAPPHKTDEVASAKLALGRKPAARRAPASTAIAHPKLDQFPSPQPLSAEEIALAQYVENFPKEAGLVAQAQEEFAIETQKVMNDAGSETRPSASNQQER
jgi:hypothetical protein